MAEERIARFGDGLPPVDPEPSLLDAMVVQAGLAAEVYCKCLLKVEGKSAHGHKLTRLFDVMSMAKQRRIGTEWQRLCDVNPALARRRDSLGGKRRFGIRRILRESEDAFTEWRYAYEGRRAEAVYPLELCVVLRAVLVAIAPSLVGGLDLSRLATCPPRGRPARGGGPDRSRPGGSR